MNVRTHTAEASNPAEASRYQAALEMTLGIPFTSGNAVAVLRNGNEIFPEMLGAIRSARNTIEFLTYIYWSGDIAVRFGKELSEASHRGVEVRVLLDSFGALWMPDDVLGMMERAGVEVRWFRPKAKWQLWRTTHRTHRKVLICDGSVGFTGGVGIAEQWCGNAGGPGEWRETHFRIEGPAVASLHAAFIGNWLEAGGAILPFVHRSLDIQPAGAVKAQVLRSAASYGLGDMAVLFHALVALASKRLRISTAYFVPDEALTGLLVECAGRGVDVELLVPGKHCDIRVSKVAAESAFEPLLSAGVRIWRYEKTMLHTKLYLIDDFLCCIGSPNMNFRSMREDDEVGVIVEDEKLCAVLNRHFDEDLCDAVEYDTQSWRKRPLVQRIQERLVSLVRWGL